MNGHQLPHKYIKNSYHKETYRTTEIQLTTIYYSSHDSIPKRNTNTSLTYYKQTSTKNEQEILDTSPHLEIFPMPHPH